MLEKDLKEVRIDALSKIESYSKKLEDLTKEKEATKAHNLQEKLMLLQIKVEEAKLRGSILDQHQRLAPNRESDNDISIAYNLLYSTIHGEIDSYADTLFQSFCKLKYIYECLECVEPESRVGIDFEGKFNEEYDANTKLWNEVQELCSQIKRLDKEVHGSEYENEEYTYEEDDDYDFIANP